jgi:DNA-binding GntR family transcriptional regulator
MGYEAEVSAHGDATAGSSLSADVYWRLRREIVRGELRPNQPLAEIDIAERLNVSRTPVRESMQRLAADGLVISRRRRWLVYEHSKQEIEEIYEVRLALEGYAARLASQRISDAQIEELSRQRQRQRRRQPAADDQLTARIAHNENFHNQLITIAGNKRLASTLTHNRNFAFNRQVASLYTPDDLTISETQHTRLVQAVLARDGDAAERIAREHIQSALEIIVARLP